jgi:hypothetical protein
MRATNIKFLLELKKQGGRIHFTECPVCERVFGTTEGEAITCSPKCDAKMQLLEKHIKESLINRSKVNPANLNFERVF